ncbi:hypothetical protein NM688_g8530 [Phlebia brevispora]|uniref:Uncharacterized protein n=1 Tax=Phlebia brevispora TaxID=194682 RepID=A0ACC1RSG6_9APHY|nr:hypothetical protein NM688_g8530 [Phlebia brevispora]
MIAIPPRLRCMFAHDDRGDRRPISRGKTSPALDFFSMTDHVGSFVLESRADEGVRREVGWCAVGRKSTRKGSQAARDSLRMFLGTLVTPSTPCLIIEPRYIMDYAAAVSDACLEDHLADRMRLDAFKLGRSTFSSSNTNHPVQKSSHARSHSRSRSVSVPTHVSSACPTPATATVATPDGPPASPPLSTTNSKRNSHHRRQSSVSTRRESAEVMGVSLPAIPVSNTEDNINLGDKDSIRRRALWTLEGKTDVGAFSKVEIPELDSAQMEKRFEFPTKPSYPPGIGAGYGSGLSGLAGSKRDSFGRFSIPCSSKEQLHTLLEEEEEDEEEDDGGAHTEEDATIPEAQPESPVEVTITTPSAAPVRHRPVGLHLRPLSLAPGSVVQATNGDLPTPLPTPSPRPRPALKSLTLATSSSTDSCSGDSMDSIHGAAWKWQSLVLTTAPTPNVIARRPSLSEGPPPVQTNRRSSISYIPSNASYSVTGLPTPEMTPTSDRRYSTDSAGSDSSRSSRGSRSLSNSEHHFLYQAHAALVQRITDLERALSARPPSRPPSTASDVSVPSEVPNDEMLQLIADLKAERDELKRDVDGWRTRVSDCERQATLLMNRVEAERREAWVARERVGLLEVEKRSLEAMFQEKVTWGEEGWRKLEEVEKQLIGTRQECQELRTELQRRTNVEQECIRLAASLAEERKRREELERELEGMLATPTPTSFRVPPAPTVSRTMVFANRGGLGFRSIDSTDSSNTDVDSIDDSFDRHESSLKVVQEEDEDESYDSDANDSQYTEEDELARYEDEDENDSYAFQPSLSDSSFESTDDLPRETAHLLDASLDDVPDLTETRSNTASPAPASPPQTHTRRNSLVKAWTFPMHDEPLLLRNEPEEVDRFFGCLEDVDNSPPLGSKLTSVESGKNLFSRALAEADDDELPFMLPANVGFEVSESRSVLEVVEEEDEEEAQEDERKHLGPNDEFVGEEVEGGIIFTFSPPPPFDEPTESQPEDVSSSDDYDSCVSHPESVESDASESDASIEDSTVTAPTAEHVAVSPSLDARQGELDLVP